MRIIGIVIVILAVMFALSSCSFKAKLGNVPDDKTTSEEAKPAPSDQSGAETKPASEAATKYRVKILEAGDERDESSRDITHTTTEFTTAVKEIYVNAGITGLTKGDTITGTMMAVDVTTPSGAKVRDAQVASADVEAPGESSTANFNFSPPDKGWPTGSYTVEIAVNGEKVDAIDLTISKPGN